MMLPQLSPGRLRPLLCAVVCTLLASGASAATQRLRYSGALLQRDANGAGVPARSLAVTAWLTRAGDGEQLVYRVDDEGRGGLAWWERCGAQSRTPDGAVSGPLPRLRHVHLARPYTLTLPGPWLSHAAPLATGAAWDGAWEGRRIAYEVTGERREANRDCWDVTGSSDTSRSQTLRVEKVTDLLVTAALRVFIGQGERFELELRLEEQTDLTEDVAARELSVAKQLLALQSDLGLTDDSVAVQLTRAQVTTAEQALAELRPSAAGTDWERFIAVVDANLTADRRRTDALQALADQRLGQPAPSYSLAGLTGQPVAANPAEGTVQVLHFWDYRGSPESPFGQVGYLDFLAGQWKGQPVQVIGVAVDGRAADPQQLRLVRRDVQKFSTEFMRLGYSIAIDDGRALTSFGDPRPLDAPLPLWVVIGPDGNVRHYRTGLYAIDPSRGLEELREAVTAALAGSAPR